MKAALQIVEQGQGVMKPMYTRLACRTDSLNFLVTICKAELDSFLWLVAFCWGKSVDWAYIDFRVPFSLYCCGKGETSPQ